MPLEFIIIFFSLLPESILPLGCTDSPGEPACTYKGTLTPTCWLSFQQSELSIKKGTLAGFLEPLWSWILFMCMNPEETGGNCVPAHTDVHRNTSTQQRETQFKPDQYKSSAPQGSCQDLTGIFASLILSLAPSPPRSTCQLGPPGPEHRRDRKRLTDM